jgi:hypothetical protein
MPARTTQCASVIAAPFAWQQSDARPCMPSPDHAECGDGGRRGLAALWRGTRRRGLRWIGAVRRGARPRWRCGEEDADSIGDGDAELFQYGGRSLFDGGIDAGLNQCGLGHTRFRSDCNSFELHRLEMLRDIFLQNCDEFRVHVGVVVRDAEDYDPLSAQDRAKSFVDPLRWTLSIAKMTSAQSMRSTETGFSASGAVPAESASTPSRVEKTASAVGLRSLFLLQTNSALITQASCGYMMRKRSRMRRWKRGRQMRS